MILRQVSFVGSAATASQFPKDNRPQIVFSGRSNVGKSSLINALLNRKNIARVSQTPGKTRLVNFFDVNAEFYFVDIPGYGYANVSKKQLLDFKILIEAYLQSPQIALCVLLLDIRRMPSDDDLLMYNYFKSLSADVLIVLTKADKLSSNKQQSMIKLIKNQLKPRENDRFIPFSSLKKTNMEQLWDVIESSVKRYQHEQVL